MAATKYTYSIANDTLNGQVDLDSLTTEIGASSIVTALDHIDRAGDVLDVWFKAGLSAPDQTTLGAVVAAHDGTAPVVEKGMVQKGHHFLATLDAATDGDVTFPEMRYLSGACAKVGNHTFGDTIELTVQHPDPQVGELAKYAETVPVPHDGVIDWATVASEEEGRADIPAGVILRVTYHSVATSGAQPEVCVYYRTHLG